MPSQFEQTFSGIASSFLRQSGIDVQKYLIGFELVEVNEQKTRAIGIFALNISGRYYYLPTFYLNSIIKPLIICYDHKSDNFTPFDKDWAEFFEKIHMPKIGKTVSKDLPPSPGDNIGSFFQPPYFGKISQDLGLKLPQMLKRASVETKNIFIKMLRDEKFLNAVNNTYDMGIIKKACEFHREPTFERQPKVKLVDSLDKAFLIKTIDKVAFLKKGYAIVDERKESEKVPIQETVEKYSSPCESGIYKLLTDQGLKKCYIGIAPKKFSNGDSAQQAIVVDLDTKRYTRKYPRELCVYDEQSIVQIPENLVELDNVKVNSKYIFINTNNGQSTCPIRIENKTKGEQGNIYLSGYDLSGFDDDCYVNIIIKKAGGLSKINKDLIIPRTYKALELDDKESLNILTANGVNYEIHKYYDEVNYDSDNKAVYKNGHLLKRFDFEKEAHFYMVSSGFSIENASDILKGKNKVLVKKGFFPVNPIVNSGVTDVNAQGPEYDLRIVPSGGKSDTYQHDLASVQSSIDKAISLSEMGMKDVFDKATIGLISKIRNVDSEFYEFIPDLSKGLDKLGRYLCTFWYNGDKIKEKYSINEYRETEERLKDVFIGLGKIVRDLKERYSAQE